MSARPSNVPCFFAFCIIGVCGVVVCLVTGGCAGRQDVAKDQVVKLEPVYRVFMHQQCEYSFLVEETPGEGQFHTHVVYNRAKESRYSWKAPRIYMDVPEGKPMWAQYKVGKEEDITFFYDLEIHLHSPKDLDSAGWQRREGKTLKSGKTTVIE